MDLGPIGACEEADQGWRLEDDGGVGLAILAPEAESPGREALGHEPEALAVVDEDAHHLAGAGSKDEDSAAEGILEQDLATGGDGTVDTPPEIEGTICSTWRLAPYRDG